MAPPRKCTADQLAFLQSRLPEYNALRNATQSAMFWVSVTAEYFVKFPIRASLIAEGKLPPEDAIIQPPASEIDAIVGAAISARKKVRSITFLIILIDLNLHAHTSIFSGGTTKQFLLERRYAV